MKSNNFENRLMSKIESFEESLSLINNDSAILTNSQINEIDSLEKSYLDWAINFIENKEKESIEFDKKELELRERKLILSKKWHRQYADFFESLEQIIKAYSKASGKSFPKLIKNPKLPRNIYDAVPESFKIVVQFAENVYWKVWLSINEPIDNDEIPSINIAVCEEIEASNQVDLRVHYQGDLHIRIEPDQNEIEVMALSKFYKAEFDYKYQISEESKILEVLLKQAIEFQILSIER